MSRWIAPLLVLASAAFVAPAGAQTAPVFNVAQAPGNDVVVLKNGGMIRGVLIEVVPNDHATVQLATGQTAIIRWAEIERIDRAGATPLPPPGPTTAPPPAPKPKAPMSGPLVMVHVESSTAVNLYRITSDGDITETCTSPCDMELPINDRYRIAGGGVMQSDDFELEGKPGERVVIVVRPGLRSSVYGGLVLAGAGLTAAIVGVYVFAIAATVNDVNNVSTGQTSSGKSNGGMIAGAVIGIGGLAAIVIGGLIALPNLSTSQSQETQTKVGAPAAPQAMNKRLPVWRETSPLDRPAAPGFVVPVFTKSF